MLEIFIIWYKKIVPNIFLILLFFINNEITLAVNTDSYNDEISGIDISIPNTTDYFQVDSTAKKITFGENDDGKLGVIYAGAPSTQGKKIDYSAVTIVVKKTATLDKISIANEINGALIGGADGNQAFQSALLIAATNASSIRSKNLFDSELSIRNGITIDATAILKAGGIKDKSPDRIGGYAALKIVKQPITTNIENNGLIDGNYSAISMLGPLNLVDGVLTNNGTISGSKYALFSYSTGVQTRGLKRKFHLENNGQITGSLKLCGNNCKITNNKQIGKELRDTKKTDSDEITTDIILHYATATIENKNKLILSSIESRDSYLKITSSGTIDIYGNANFSLLNNKKSFKASALELSKKSSNTGVITLDSMSTKETITNTGHIHVNQLKSSIIDNQSELVITEKTSGNITILGTITLNTNLIQSATLSVTNVAGKDCLLINEGSINISDSIKIKEIDNQANFIAGTVDLTQYKIVKGHEVTTLGSITNDTKGTMRIKNITNANIINKGELTITGIASGKIIIFGKLNINNLQQKGILIANDLEGRRLINHGNATITSTSKLEHLENYGALDCSGGNFTLISTSTNSGKLFIQTLTSSGTLSNEKSGVITCNGLQDCKIINLGELNVKKLALGNISIKGSLKTTGNFTNKSVLVADSFIALKQVINLSSMTIGNIARINYFNNNSHLAVAGTLSFSDTSINANRLDVNVLEISAELNNKSSGKISINVLKGIDKNKIIKNDSSSPESLVIKKNIYGNVTIEGWLYLAENLKQQGNLTATNIEGKYLINEGQIIVKNNAILTNLINKKNSNIAVFRQIALTGYATNDGNITTSMFENKGFFYNTGNLEIKSQATGVILDNKHYTNKGSISANTIIIPASFTNDGILTTANLKNNGVFSIINTSSPTNASNKPTLKISKSIVGDFLIHNAVECSGNIMLVSNFTAQSLKADVNDSFTIDTKSSLIVLNNANLGKLINNGSVTVHTRLTLQNTSVNNSQLYACGIKCENTLTNEVNAVAKFGSITSSNIDNSATNAVLQVFKCIEGDVNISGDLILTGTISQGGNLRATRIKSKEYGINVSDRGSIIADDIEVKKINNRGNIVINKNLVLTDVSTNTGIINTKIFNCKALFNNDSTATLYCTKISRANIVNQKKAIFKVNKLISGNSTIKGCLNIGTKVNLDAGVNLIIDRITSKQNSSFIINERSILEIKESFTENNINIINNEGILKIESGSEFKSYVGNKGQIRLKIPANLSLIKKTLIKVHENFDCNISDDKHKPGIIIYPDRLPTNDELQKEFKITLIQAKTIKILKSGQDALVEDFIASEKIKPSSILLYIDPDPDVDPDNLKITKAENQPDSISAKIRWLDVQKISYLDDKPIAIINLAKVMQQFAAEQSKKALHVQLDNEIKNSRFRSETKEQLDYLLSPHPNQEDIEEHLTKIKDKFFIAVDYFAKHPVKLFENLEEYKDYEEYQAGKKISPLINPNFYDLVEKIIIDNSDISHIVISENIKNLFSGISDRLVVSRVNGNTNDLHQGLNLVANKNNAYTWSSFCINKTKEKQRFGFIINNFSNNIGYLGIDRSFDYLHLGWTFGYSSTTAKNLGTRLTQKMRNNSYNFMDISTAIYCNYKQNLTSATFAVLFGHSKQHEFQELIGKKLAGSCTANLAAMMGEFTYTYYIGNLNFDMSGRFEYHHIVIPEHYLETEVELFVPTIKAGIKHRSVSNRINLGAKACALYTLPISPFIEASATVSISYIYNINLQKDRIQEVEFFKKLFYIENKEHCKHTTQFDLALLFNIYKSFNLRLGTSFSYHDYSQSLGGKIALHYYF